MIPVDQEEKRRTILRAALAVFARKGYERATISDIASEAGIGKGVVYDYFRSKEDLFADLFEFLFPMNDEVFGAVVKVAATPAAEIQAVAGAVLKHYESLGDYFNVVAQFWARGQSETAAPRFSENWGRLFTFCRAQVADSVRRGVASGEFRADLEPDATAWSIIAVIDGSILQWLHSRGQKSLSEQGLQALRLLLRGMAPAGAAGSEAPKDFFDGRSATERSVIEDAAAGSPS